MIRRAPQMPAVFILHGALGAAGQMLPIEDELFEQECYPDVCRAELPGHGLTPLAEGDAFTTTMMAHSLFSAVEHSDPKRPLLFGYSMGGYVALLLEHMMPGALGGVITLGTKFDWTPEVAAKAAARLDPQLMREKVPSFAATLATRHAQQRDGWEGVVRRTASLLRGLGDAPPLTPEVLAGIQCPVHLLVGDQDDTVTLEETTRAASHLPHARVSLLPDTPHPIEKVNTALLAQEVREFADLIATAD